MNSRESPILAEAELANTQTCGNCRRWAHSGFQSDHPDMARCAWPLVIKPRPGDKPTPPFSIGVEIVGLEMWRDDGGNCKTFLRDKSPEDTLSVNRRLGKKP